MSEYDLSLVPRDLLEMYVKSSMFVLNTDNYKQSDLASLVLQAARKPLRTRAQVDADIVSAVRKFADEHDWHTTQVRGLYGVGAERLAFKLKSIIDEETSD